MSAADVDAYLAACPEPARAALEDLRSAILEVLPDAEQLISYKVPAFRSGGRTVAGFAAFRTHLSYLPFSGGTLPAMGDAIAGYGGTKSALHFTPEKSLPKSLVRRLIEVRLAEPERSRT